MANNSVIKIDNIIKKYDNEELYYELLSSDAITWQTKKELIEKLERVCEYYKKTDKELYSKANAFLNEVKTDSEVELVDFGFNFSNRKLDKGDTLVKLFNMDIDYLPQLLDVLWWEDANDVYQEGMAYVDFIKNFDLEKSYENPTYRFIYKYDLEKSMIEFDVNKLKEQVQHYEDYDKKELVEMHNIYIKNSKGLEL